MIKKPSKARSKKQVRKRPGNKKGGAGEKTIKDGGKFDGPRAGKKDRMGELKNGRSSAETVYFGEKAEEGGAGSGGR